LTTEIRTNAARHFFEPDIQISASAVELLAIRLNKKGYELADKARRAFEEENRLREIHNQPKLERLLPRHVKEALENDG
jgi:hypothetical protein